MASDERWTSLSAAILYCTFCNLPQFFHHPNACATYHKITSFVASSAFNSVFGASSVYLTTRPVRFIAHPVLHIAPQSGNGRGTVRLGPNLSYDNIAIRSPDVGQRYVLLFHRWRFRPERCRPVWTDDYDRRLLTINSLHILCLHETPPPHATSDFGAFFPLPYVLTASFAAPASP